MMSTAEEVVTTETTTPEVPQTEAPATTDQAATTPPPEFVPDFSYEFDGKKREIDPFFRTIIKDEDSLKKVRDYIQRADASTKYREKMTGYEKDWKPVVDNVNKLQQYFAKGEHDRVFEALGYDDETLFKYVKSKLDQAQMPQEQQQIIEAKRMAELEKERLLEENNSYREHASQELARVTDIELDMELAKPQYATLTEAYDKAYGDGSFKTLVIDRGAYMVSQQGQHIRPGQLLSVVAKDFMPFLAGQQGNPIEQQTQQKPKVIPNVGRGSGSPARQAIRSLSDLKARSKQLGE